MKKILKQVGSLVFPTITCPTKQFLHSDSGIILDHRRCISTRYIVIYLNSNNKWFIPNTSGKVVPPTRFINIVHLCNNISKYQLYSQSEFYIYLRNIITLAFYSYVINLGSEELRSFRYSELGKRNIYCEFK